MFTLRTLNQDLISKCLRPKTAHTNKTVNEANNHNNKRKRKKKKEKEKKKQFKKEIK